jgi:hypothetical protein
MSAEDEERIAKIPKGSRTTWKGRVIDRRSAGRTGKRRGRLPWTSGPKTGRPKGRARSTGRKPTGRGLFPSSIAATMAARGL